MSRIATGNAFVHKRLQHRIHLVPRSGLLSGPALALKRSSTRNACAFFGHGLFSVEKTRHLTERSSRSTSAAAAKRVGFEPRQHFLSMPSTQYHWFVFTKYGCADGIHGPGGPDPDDLHANAEAALQSCHESGRGPEYLAWSREICPETGRPHLQGFAYCRKRLTCFGFRKLLGCWADGMRGRVEDSEAYCSKAASLNHLGKMPGARGARTDLTEACDQVRGGKDVNELIVENPILYHQFGRTLTALQDVTNLKKYRTEMTQGKWYWGSTGVGKSHTVFQDYDPTTHYVLNLEDNGWWDGYAGQQIVILNDFRGQLPYSQMLNLLDKWPYSVKRRNRPPFPFTSKEILITASLPPEDVYHNLSAKDGIDQLLRRLEVYHVTG